MSEVPAALPAQAPDWVAEARQKYSLRLRDYLEQTQDFTWRPRHTAREWISGAREFLNPVRYLALGFAAVVAVRHIGELHVLGPPNEDASLAALFSKPWASQVLVLLLAAFTHPWLRWMGSRSPLRASIAMSFFAFAGPAVVLEVGAWTVSMVWHSFAGGAPLWPLVPEIGPSQQEVPAVHYSHYPAPVMVISYASFFWFGGTMIGVHGLEWWRGLIGLVAGTLSLMIAFGLLVAVVSALTKTLG